MKPTKSIVIVNLQVQIFLVQIKLLKIF